MTDERRLQGVDRRRRWRTLVRVEAITRRMVFVVVPGWDPRQTVVVPRATIPPAIELDPGVRLHAKVNIGAERVADLIFSDWEDR